MTQFKISLQNEAGELDCRVVDTEEEIRGAALELVAELASVHDGDRIIVTEIEAKQERPRQCTLTHGAERPNSSPRAGRANARPMPT